MGGSADIASASSGDHEAGSWENAVQDRRRLDSLRKLRLLDTAAEDSFDRISKLATTILEVPIALVSLVDADRQFFKSCVGLPEPWSTWRETPLSSSFCKHVVATGRPLVLENASLDPRHRANEAIQALGAVAYLGCPLEIDGSTIGSFCVIDTAPRDWSKRDIGVVGDLAQCVMTEIALRAVAAKHESALRSREKMLAIVSHDLRSPLQSILTSLALLESPENGREEQKWLDVSKRSAARMTRLIKDLLDASTVESDRLSVKLEPVSVQDIVEEARSAISQAAVERGQTLTFDVEQGLVAAADRDRLLQLLHNLLDNAIRHTPDGGNIIIGAQRHLGGIVVSVSDTGPGVPDEQKEKIFEWSWHTPQEKKRGTGLGLTIARGIVEAHGGKIWVDDAYPTGANFSFTLRESRP